ncbi:MAG: TetR/AcrR family transcriptional regulator [Pseudomonadota bacterium]
MTTTKKSRGRPSGFDKEKALETAQQLFHARGFDAVGVAELSDAMGVQPPSLYAAFGNKASLFAKAVERYSATDGGFMEEALRGAPTVAKGLERLLVSAAEQYSAEDETLGCLVMENTRCTSDTNAKKLCLSKYAATQDWIRSYLDKANPNAADAISRQVMVALAGLSAAARTGSGREDLIGFAKTVSVAMNDALVLD